MNEQGPEIVSSDTGPPESLFFSERLRSIIPPEGFNTAPYKKIQGKALSKRGTGALKIFVEMSLDIVFEIASYLDPVALLTLARLSKEFRALFMSRSTMTVWRRVLALVKGLPPCPSDLMEPQYASLLFEKFCMACLTTRGSIYHDFNLRLRLCTKCVQRNTIMRDDLVGDIPHIHSFSVLFLPHNTESDFLPVMNKARGCTAIFFVPEVEDMVAKMVRARKAAWGEDVLAELIGEQNKTVGRMLKEGTEIQSWFQAQEKARLEAESSKRDERYEKILEETRKLGWQPGYFPKKGDDEYKQWSKFVDQPKEFSQRSWNMMQHKLADLYASTKAKREKEDLRTLLKRATPHIRRQLPIPERHLAPSWKDLTSDGKGYKRVKRFVDDHHADFMNNLDLITDFLKEVLTHCPRYVERKRDGLLLSIEHQKTKLAKTIIDSDDPLSQARVFFTCIHSSHEKGDSNFYDRVVLPYPEIVGHAQEDIPRGIYGVGPLHFESFASTVAMDILHALGLDDDALRDKVDALGDFVCGCGHPRYSGPLSFSTLVEHVYQERQWYKRIKRHILADQLNEAKENLFDSHRRSNLPKLIRRSPEAEDREAIDPAGSGSKSTPLRGGDAQEEEIDSGDEMSVDESFGLGFSDDSSDDDLESEIQVSSVELTDVPDGHSCSTCFKLTGRLDLSGVTHEPSDYHMRTKHGIKDAAPGFMITSNDKLIRRTKRN